MHTDNQVISVLAAAAGASVLWWKCDDVITSSSVSAVCPRVTAWLHDCMTPPTRAACCILRSPGGTGANHLQQTPRAGTRPHRNYRNGAGAYAQVSKLPVPTHQDHHQHAVTPGPYFCIMQPIWQCSCSPLRAKYLLMIFIPDAEFIVAECPGDAEDTPSARQGERWRWCA